MTVRIVDRDEIETARRGRGRTLSAETAAQREREQKLREEFDVWNRRIEAARARRRQDPEGYRQVLLAFSKSECAAV